MNLRPALLLVFVLCSLNGCTNKSTDVSEKVVLSVNGQEMRANEFADELAVKLRDYDALAAKDPEIVDRAKAEVIRNFVIGVMTADWAKANNVFVRKEDLDSEIQSIRKSYPDNTTFEAALAEQKLTFRLWRESVSANLLQKLVIKKLTSDQQAPSDKEVRSYYDNNRDSFERPEQIKLRQILLANESDARAIETELKKGRAMADLAEKYSISSEKRRQGDLGWVERGVSETFDQGFSMRVGQRSEIIKSPYGYHIFEVVSKRPSRTQPFDEVKEKIRRQLAANREQAVYSAWLEAQLRKARVLKDEQLISSITIQTKGR